MLPLPLEEVRRRLGVDDPTLYERLDHAETQRLRAKSPALRFLNTVLPA